jgi:putative aldouronate transport system substrate-binding protein
MKKSAVLSFGVGLFLLLAMLGGCGKKDASRTASSGSGEKVTIEIYQASGIQQPVGDAAFVQNTLEKELNIKIEMVSGAQGDDYLNQLNVRLAAGDPPDIFEVTTRDLLVDLVHKGILLELTPYLGRLQDYVALADTAIKKGAVGKELYGITNYMNMAPTCTIFIRQDWLDNLGLKAPSTLEEFRNVAIAFTRNDPDGNGQNDTYGFGAFGLMTSSATTGSGFNDIYGAYGVPNPGDTFIKDGKVVNALEDPAMPQALAFIADLYKAGLIDPQAFSNSYIQCQQGGIQGKYGMMNMSFFDLRKPNYIDQILAVNPKANWVELYPVSGPGGAYTTPSDIAGGGNIRSIPASLTKNPEKLNKVLELINYVSGGEGLKLVQYGLEGRHHKRDASGEVIEITQTLLDEGSYLWSWQFGGRPEQKYYRVRWPTMLYDQEFNAKVPQLKVYNSIITPPSDFNVADANTFINESLVAFVTGATSLSEYPRFLNTLKSRFGYQKFIDSAAQQLKDMGYVN